MFPSDDDTNRPLIRNEETLRRRDWIDSALAAVRDRLACNEAPAPEARQAAAGRPAEILAAASPDLPHAATSRKAARPRLYVVRNAGHR